MGLPWVRLDTQWPHNPKFLQLVEDKKFRAITVYMAGLAWAGAQGQSGFVAGYALPLLHGTKRDANDLVGVHLWIPTQGGWDINDWAEYQPTSEENMRRSDRARKAAMKRWHGAAVDA